MTGSMVGSAVRPETLAGLLKARAAEQPGRAAYLFLANGEADAAERLTWGELDRRARAIAAALAESVPPGERALLLFPPGLDFIAAFFGCLYAGVVAVPAYPPRPNDRSQLRLRAIARDAAPRAALTTAALAAGALAAGTLAERVPELAAARFLAIDTLPADADAAELAEPDPGALAFLQYTSGSTATPKGVMVTHANLVHNERMIGEAFGVGPDSVVVGWLPLYHDMGLIGNVLQPLHAGALAVLMPPVAFLQRPRRWLEAIDRYRGTTSGGPNFAYDLCVRKIPPAERRGLDLSSWQVAFNGAEPVRAFTLERFAEAFAPNGFRRQAFYPCYGLAEATLFAAGGDRGRAPRIEPRIEEMDAAALARGEAVPAGEAPARALVGCGHAFLGQRIAIVDAETGGELPAGRVGEIWIAGESVARGYWGEPEATARAFGARLANGEGPFLRTGDLGLVSGGELFVTGRLKDLIILRGRNHYPQDIEATAEKSHPGLRPGGAAAFAVEVDAPGSLGAEERLVVVQEVERRRPLDSGEHAEAAAAVRRAIAEEHEVQPYEVVLVRAGTVPKTSSGKVQRSACRELYLAGELAVVERSVVAATEEEEKEEEKSWLGKADVPDWFGLAEIGALPFVERAERIEALVRRRAAAALGVTAEAVDPERPLTALGLDSLSAVEIQGAVEAALGVPMPLADLLSGATARELAARMAVGREIAEPTQEPVWPVVADGDQPLSIGQKALWFLERLAPEAGVYNVAVAGRARGLDAGALRRALERMAARHPALRTVFAVPPGGGDEPVQRILPAAGIDFAVVDAGGWSEGQVSERLAAEAWRPFDLARGPLLRARLFARADGERVLLLAVHHMVADFWSLGLLARELGVLYAGGPGVGAAPPARGPGYADFARRQSAALAGPAGERLWDFWRGALAGERGPLPDLALPTDRPRPPLQTWRGLARAATLPADLLLALRRLAAAEGASLFALLAAAWQVQLGRYAGQDDFALGTPTSGRGAPEWAEVVGYFVNPVALRADLSGRPTFRTVLDRARGTALAALEHAAYPFALLAERLRPVRDPARPPLFQVLLTLEQRRAGDDPGLAAFALGEDGARISLGGAVELVSVGLAERRAPFELNLAAAELPGGGLGLSLAVNADLFDAATAERMLGHLRTLLAGAAAAPSAPIAALPLLAPAERQQLLVEWNDTETGTAAGRLHDLVAAQAARTPDAVAVVGWGETSARLTYGGLAVRAGRVAASLRELGIGPESRVGLCLPRTPDLVAAILGVLQAGGAYVPLDPAYPPSRLELMLADSGAAAVLTESSLAARFASFPGRTVLLDRLDRLDREPAAGQSCSDGNLAYVIFTSGSTGRPKGVGIEHRSAVALVRWALAAFRREELAGVLAATSVCFDLSVFEIFAPLAAGGRILLAPNALGLAELPSTAEATLLNTVPSPMAELVGAHIPPGLRTVNLAGEALTPDLAARVYAHPQVERVVNLYGPSEDTVYSTAADVPRGAALVPIGRPIAGTRARVVGEAGEPLPAGVPGALVLGGDGLARGYLGRPELTAERFVPDPWGPPGARMYRTGDRARLLADGQLDFLGRLDDQVKIRGFRVEPGEVEAALAEHPGVGRAAVLAVPAGTGGERRLVAFVAPTLPADLRAFLAGRLPEAMIPAAWLALPELPLTPSGKVDRAALNRRSAEAGALARTAADGAAAADPAAELLAGILAELLGRERVGVHDDFFDLGGHSLLATRAVARISRLLGVDLPVTALFAAPTAAGLAARIAAAQGEAAPPVRPVPRAAGEPTPLSFAQRGLWLVEQLAPGTAVYNMPGAVGLAGPLDVPALQGAIAAIVRRQESLRTVFAASPEGGGPAARVEPAAAFPPARALPVVDLSGLAGAHRGAEADGRTREEARRPFDLARRPPFRALLLRLDPAEHRLLATFHHIAADGWSLGVFLDELAALYAAGAARPAADALPELPVQYADFAVWQAEWLRGEVLARQLAYWRARLSGLPALELPTDRPRPAVRDPRGATRALRLPPETAAAVARLARRHGVTPFMTLLGAFQALLARLTGEAVIPVGSPVANRRRPEVERLIGLFVNSLVLDVPVGDDPAWGELLARVRQACLGAYAHQDLPFERLVEELAPERDRAQNPLFQVMLVLEEPLAERDAGGLIWRPARGDSAAAKLDLLLAVAPLAGGGWELLAEHPTALWDASTVDRLLGHFRTLLEAAAADPAVRLSALPLLSAAERQQIAIEWNDTTQLPEEAGARLEELVAAQAARAPDAVALVGPDTGSDAARLSYGGLLARARRLAAALVARGIGPEVRVGLCLPRTPDLIVAILGVLEAGGAYVPLDPAHPDARLAMMLADAGAEALLTDGALAPRFAAFAGPRLLLEDLDLTEELPRAPVPAPDRDRHLAYVVYTSGSTGRPKGVAIEHRGVVAFVRWARELLGNDLAGVLAASSVSFDISILETFVPLAAGGRVILAPNVLRLAELPSTAEVTLLNTVPSPMAALVDGALPSNLRTVILGGEALKPELAARIYAHPQVERVIDLYGPSEDSVYSTFATVPRGAALVAVGRPVAGEQVRVLDRAFAAALTAIEPLPIGAAGEVVISGAGVARGYLGRPELTAERFVPDPCGPPGARRYRTGDLARLLPDGQLDYLGRLDDQVKIRGYRIEPGEVAAALAEHPGVRQAAVLALPGPAPGGERRLVAFVAPELPIAELRAFLAARLLDAMVPRAWLALPALPLTPNGKADRAALTRLAADAGTLEPAGREAPEAAPEDPVQELLAGAFAELLGCERVGLHDDFFALGGHSLSATRLVAQVSRLLGVELPVASVFEAPTVAGLAARIAEAARAASSPVSRARRREAGSALPLSSAQRRLWFLEQLEPGTAVYNVPGAGRLTGPLDVPALRAAIGEVVRRHEVLRTVFPARGGEPALRVEPAAAPDLPVVDLASLDPVRREEEAERRSREEARRPFDLARGPLLRTLLLGLGPTEHRLLATFHHIVADGWSLGLFLDEFAALYPALAAGERAPSLAELPLQYADFAAWQEEWLASGVVAEQLAYWRERLAGLPALELPTDRPRPPARDPRGRTRASSLPPATAAAVARLARRQGVTLFMAVLGIFQSLLARWTGEAAIPVGSPVANRRHPQVERLIGLFVNTLVLDARVGDDPALGELLARVRQACLGAYAHQDLPFERLVEELAPSRDLRQNPLVQVVLTVEEPLPARAAGDLAMVPARSDSGTAKFDLLLAVSPRPEGGWDLLAEHPVALWEPVTIDRLLGHFQVLLESAAAADPATPLSALPMLTLPERQQIAVEWNDTAAAFPRGARLHDLIAAQAARLPDAVAVVGAGLAGDERLTYGELLARARRLGATLRSLGIGPERRVGLSVERTPELVVGVLGILAAGGVYVPLDPNYPHGRLEFMLADSGAEVLLTSAALAGRLDFAGPVVRLGADWERIAAAPEAGGPARRSIESIAENLAYVIYTSGSTGRPKGIAIAHASAVNMVRWTLELFTPEDLGGSLAATSVGFDVSIFETFAPLAAGGRLILAPNLTALPQLAAAGELALLTGVPSPMAELAGGRLPAGARTVNLGGEALKLELVERLYAHPQVERVLNLYGPAENTTYSTWSRVPRGAPLVPIGRPVANTGARVLGPRWEAGEPLPIGVPGELFVHGDSLSRGYLGRPELTAERFLPDPLGPPGARMYRTGDRARLLPDGQLDYLGRIDHQIKLRGVRLELGEIEVQLEEHPAVRQAVVALREDGPGGPRLVAYVVPADGAAMDLATDLAEQLRGWLGERLPAVMVPAAWVVLAALPLSPNGKVDRRALPAPAGPAGELAAGVAPRTDVEATLAALWGEVLGREGIGVHDDFFALGGHSLLALRAAFRVSEAFGVELPVSALFEAPTVAALAERLGRTAGPTELPLAPEAASGAEAARFPLSSSQQRIWFVERLQPGGLLYNLQAAIALAGRLDAAALGRALAEIVRRHEPLRTVFPEVDGEPLQEVLPAESAAPLARLSLAGLPPSRRGAALAGALAAEAERPFDLVRGPLARFLLIESGAGGPGEPQEHVLSATFHHIAVDGWSLGLFAQELAALYAAFASALPSPLPALARRYRDVVAAERQALAGPALDDQIRFWRERLAGVPPLDLPGDRPRPAAPTTRAVARRIELPPDLAAALGEVGRARGVTPFTVYCAAFAALLARLTGQEDFGIGVPIAGRRRAETRGMIGLFINTLVLRAPLAGDPAFPELLRRLRDGVVAAQAHQDVPFERLVDELHAGRDGVRNVGVTPLFQALFGYLSDPLPPLAMPGLTATLLDLAPRVEEFDLALSLHEWEGRLGGWLSLHADLFDATTAARIAGHLQALLAGIAADPARRLSELPFLSAAERRQLREWSGEPEPWRDGLLQQRFEERARRAPDDPAIVADGETVSFAELDARANRLAHHLLALGLPPEGLVAVCLERSLALDVTLLAALKAGGVYLPLDPTYPPARIREVLEDSGAGVLVSLAATAARLPLDGLPAAPALVLLDLDRDAAAIAGRSAERPAVAIDPRALAYVFYTSGSTGKPKGVALPHGAGLAHLDAIREVFGLRPGDRILQFASPGFDVSLEQILNPLNSGAALVVAGTELLAPHELTRRIGELGLTYVELPTAYWNRWASDPAPAGESLDPAAIATLRLVIVGSEEMLPAHVQDWLGSPFAAVRLINVYGPTEAVCTTTTHVVEPADGERSVPIGRSVPGRSSWVLDRAGNPQPAGVPGELLHGGPLARGYLGRPQLTAERFVPDPFSGQPGARLYRTGDRARFRPDGAIEFLGRIDGQVKIRGFRVELGEVEAALSRHPAVAEAAVAALPGPGGDRYLAAWVVPAVPGGGGGEGLAAVLRTALGASLPEHMVPAAWTILAALPLNAHGKIDRRALPAPQLAVGGGEETAPATPEQELVAGLFADLLGRERVGPEDGFFELGGHSLLATQLASRVRAAFGVELPLAAVFEEPTPAALARRLTEIRHAAEGAALGAVAATPPPILSEPGREPGTTAPLSYSQQRLWFLHQLEPDDAYHVPGALRFRGSLREDVLARAVGEIVRRHESLRTVFRVEGREPLQVVLPPDAGGIPVADLTALPAAARDPEATRLLELEARRPFDLAAGPLVRTLLIRLRLSAAGEPAERLLSVVMHHIVSDAWSLGAMLRELSALYTAYAAGAPSPLPELSIQYPDFARWQRRWLSGAVLQSEVEHWRRALAGAPESLELPYDRPPSPEASNRGGRLPVELPAGLYGPLVALARREGLTAFMALLAGFQALLARTSGQEDVVVGAPIANRTQRETEELIGFLTNTLALRLDLAGDPPFRELGRRVRAAALDAYAHQHLPFEKLVEELAPDRHLGRNPLFQTLLVLQRLPPPPALPGIETTMVDVERGAAKFDLTLMLVEEEGAGAAGTLEYARALFDESTVDRLLVHLRTLLEGAVAEPDRRLSELPLLTAAEQAELALWTRPLAPDPPALLVHDGVAAQAARTPLATAAVDGAESLTYGELVARARRLARRLRALGVGPDVPVGLFLERSLDMMIAVLGVLEAGGAYLPLDPGYPTGRLRAMLADAGAPVLLTHAALAAAAPLGSGEGLVVRVDDPDLRTESTEPLPPCGVTPEHLAYVVYTSGSTGRPKGVAMTHGAAAAMLRWQLRTSAAGAGRTLQFTSLAFDVSFQEIFSTWWAGGALVLVSEDVRRDPPALARLLAEQRVERLFLPFVALQQVAIASVAEAGGGAFPASLREVLSAGEQLYVTPQVAALFARLPGASLHNHYGPSETHAVTWLALAGDAAGWPDRPAIGGPVDHARVFLLDPWLQPMPVGVAGEIWVGGAGLARGYLGRPELTAERFLPDPFAWAAGWRPGDRLYRTGDLARRRADGALEFRGRGDAQVKIRGHRVEPAEVETALAHHPAVQQAAVAVGSGPGEGAGARRLVAYVVFRPEVEPPDFGALRTFLAESLPGPMVPTAWARVDALPLTVTGKLDRRALSRIEPAETGGADEPFAAPRTPLTLIEELLAGIWSEVLGRERIGVDDDFFALGGHSLLATQVASRIREVFAVELPLRQLFQAPTLRELAAALAEAAAAATAAGADVPAAPPLGREPRPAELPLSFAQERLWFLDRLQPGSAAYNLSLALRAAGRLDPARLAAALAGVVRRHEVLRTVFAERDGIPMQVILPAASATTAAPMAVVDLAALPADRREAAARTLGREEAARPFDLARGPLLRAVLVDLEPERSMLLVSMHHVVADGWSLGVLVQEVKTLYAGGEPPELAVQYADFALWQRRWLAGETLARQLAWWRRRLAGAPGALELPTDRPRPPVASQRGAELRFDLAPATARRLAAVAAREGTTPFMALAAVLFAFLQRVSGQRDLAIGAPIANRTRLETERLIGFFVNTLVLRAEVGRGASFGDLLRQVREASLGVFAHQDVPFEKLVDELRPERDLSRSPLFQVALLLQNAPLPEAELGGVRLVPAEPPAEFAKFDLSFAFVPGGPGEPIAATLQYATDLFEATTAARLARGFVTLTEGLLEGLIADARAPLAAAPLLAAAERQQILREWNDTRAPLALAEPTVHRRFETWAERQPDAVAAAWEGASLTYGALEARANRLAHLLQGLGAAPGTAVAVWMERSLDAVAAVLGALKAGACYVPIDPAWPVERAAAILIGISEAGAHPPIVLTRSRELAAVQEIQWRLPLAAIVCLDVAAPEPPPEAVDAEAVRALWDFVAEQAVDRETAGGFVSSYTGLPFAAAEVDAYRDRVLALAAPWLRPAARVLEIGCGAGLLLWEMAPRVARAVGLDPSPATQERNRAHAAARGIANVELPVGFAHELDRWGAGPFDLIVLASTVQFFPGPVYLERIVEQALRRLAPGGALLVADVPDARRREELRASLAAAGAPVSSERGRERWWDAEQFRAFAALPEVAEVAILPRPQGSSEGFDNELRFRYDVLLRRREGASPAPAPAEPARRLWTGWHLERQPSGRPASAAGPEDLAYVIHTSGSTGEPKGIGVQHRPLLNHFGWVNGTYGIGPGDRLLAVNSLGFDLSVYDLLGTLAAGGTVQVAPEAALRDPARLVRLLVEEPVTVWHSAPSALLQLAPLFPPPPSSTTEAPPLRLAMLAGDWIPLTLPGQIRAAFPRATVLNLGGATETSVWSNVYRIDAVDPRWTSIPYGRPIANARYHVLDEELSPCPIGVVGDMVIGGETLSLGYVGRAEMTAERFLPDPFAERPGARLWVTGDRGRYAADGNLEFLGRGDQQVKVRGYRIEPGEIEVALARHPGVREAVVLAREDVPGERRLVAYLVPRVPSPPASKPTERSDRTAELRAFLQASLPEYMVPWDFVELERLPVTANGKLDRDALPAPREVRAATVAYVAPRNDLERAIDAVWREVLGLERVGVGESFFQVGGSSLLLARLQSRLRQALGREIPFVELFRHPTIESLARSLEAAGGTEAEEQPAERARARTETRRAAMRRVQQRRRPGNGRGERHE